MYKVKLNDNIVSFSFLTVALASLNDQPGLGVATFGTKAGNPLDHVLARLVGNPAKDHVLLVQPEIEVCVSTAVDGRHNINPHHLVLTVVMKN